MNGKIAIFIPAHNEARTIASVVLLAKKHGRVFVVDDGSDDATALLARQAGARVISRKTNGGYGAAVRSAFEAAGKITAGAFVFLDADFQHDPDEIPAVAAPVLKGEADVCLGSRFSGGFLGAPAYRKAGVSFFNYLSGMHTKSGGLDYECGFRAFSRKAIGAIRIRQDGYGACSQIVVAAQEKGLSILQVPVHVRYYEDVKGAALAHGAGLLGGVVGELARRRPLAVFGLGGIACLAVSAALGIFVAETFYSTRVLATGSAFLTVFFGIVGFIFMLIGINLYTLGKILDAKEGGGK